MEVARGLQALDRLPEAEQQLREILANHHKNIAALIALGLVQRQLGRHNRSLAYFQNAADINAKHSGVKFETGYSLRALNRLPEAESMFRDVLSITPNHLGALIALGQMLRQRGDYSGSLSLFEQAARSTQITSASGWRSAGHYSRSAAYRKPNRLSRKSYQNRPVNLPAVMTFGTVFGSRGAGGSARLL